MELQIGAKMEPKWLEYEGTKNKIDRSHFIVM